MKVGILGYGKEGQSAEKYFQSKGDETQVFDHFTPESLAQEDLSGFDLILRSPSLPPQDSWSSMTKYFFDHCPCQIIGITGTKGKGTTSSLISDLLRNLGQKVWLVGNIGNPSIDVLDQIQPSDIVVYEMSSFQLWDLTKSPHIAVITNLEPDHLNVHTDYADYINAKANIAKHQTADDYLIYHLGNPDITNIAKQSPSKQITYPCANETGLDEIISHLSIPGQHNRDNAEAALFATACALNQPIDTLISQNRDIIIKTLENFQGLPHRLQFLRKLNGVRYFDDNFSTTTTSLQVALESFPEQKVVVIAGGRDKTNGKDIPKVAKLLQRPNVARVILIGESGHELAKILDKATDYTLAKTLPDAVQIAQASTEELANTDDSQEVIVLMSPAAASFDMFENVYDRGAQFQKLIQELGNKA